ncbi:MAG: peroxiredoxin [Verrucomicrobia bacterium]|nr:peroxiredoxin [Cytophagales bacterium]
MLQKGDKAPDFKLFNSDKKEVSLSDFNGKNLVVMFFPQAFTSVCTTELCTIRDNYAAYENLNADVVGISVDSVFTLDKFKKEEKYNFPLLSDFNKETSRAYEAIYEEGFPFGMKGVSRRAAFVIDKNGTIQHVEVLESAGDLPDFEAVKNALANLQ